LALDPEPLGTPGASTFTTVHEIEYLEHLYIRKGRAAFEQAANSILENRRTYDGDGMGVNVKKLKKWIEGRLAEIQTPKCNPPDTPQQST
jgi:hypothetical protein